MALLPETRMQDYRANLLPLLSSERFGYIRELRCEKHKTWRGVSTSCMDAWPDVKSAFEPEYGHQPIGMAMCEFAATHFGENAEAAPWN